MRVSPHYTNSRRAYASLVATSIPAFRRPCTPPAGFWAAPGFANPAPFLQRHRQDGSINLDTKNLALVSKTAYESDQIQAERQHDERDCAGDVNINGVVPRKSIVHSSEMLQLHQYP